MEELIENLINSKVGKFSFQSISEQLDTLKAKFDLEVKDLAKGEEQIKEIYETRNLYVHNKGIISKLYFKKIKDSKFTIGEPRNIDHDYVAMTIDILSFYAEKLLENALEKY